jgi:hypothetical protein
MSKLNESRSFLQPLPNLFIFKVGSVDLMRVVTECEMRRESFHSPLSLKRLLEAMFEVE